MLVEAQGRVVPKEVLLNRIWSGTAVEESNLTQTVFLIRRALGTLPNGGSLIETLPRNGYRVSPRALTSIDQTQHAAGSRLCAAKCAQFARPTGDHWQLFMHSVEGYALYTLDSTGRILGRNPAAQRFEGYSQEEIIGKHHSVLFTPEDIEARIPESELRIAERRGHYAGETSLIKDGKRYWANFEVTVVRDPEGKMLGFTKIVQDVTERKNRSDALRCAESLAERERDRIAAVLDIIMDGCCICEPVRDKRGRIEDLLSRM